MAPTIVIVGATGNIGQAVAQALSQQKDQVHVKAVVRNPSSPKADMLRKMKGIEVVKGDLADPASLDGPLRGATAAYINTPGSQNRQQLTINGLEAAKKAGVGHVVFISFPNMGNEMIFTKQILPVENKVKQLGIPYTIVQATLFIDNQYGNATDIKNQGKLFGPAEPTKKYCPIAVQDVGMAIAQTLIDGPKKHNGKTYLITGKSINHTDMAHAFNQAIGKPVEYVRVPYETAKKTFMERGMPEWQTDGLLEYYRVMDKGQYPAETNDFKTLTGKDPTTFNQWLQAHSASFK